MQPNSETDQTANKNPHEENAVQGGLPDQPPPENQQETPAGDPVYSSSAGDFKTVEELTEYTKSLEKKQLTAAQAEQELDARNEASRVLREELKDPKKEEPSEIDDLMYTNAPEYRRRLKDEVKAEIKDEQVIGEARRDFWDEFYSENTDLQPYRRVVKFIERDCASEFKDLSLKQAKVLVAERTREFIQGVRKKQNVTTTELETTNTQTLNSSGERVPTQPPKEEKALNFVEQMKQLRAKRQKAG